MLRFSFKPPEVGQMMPIQPAESESVARETGKPQRARAAALIGTKGPMCNEGRITIIGDLATLGSMLSFSAGQA
jgi:hypothetical protein